MINSTRRICCRFVLQKAVQQVHNKSKAYNKLHNKSTTARHVEMLWICCSLLVLQPIRTCHTITCTKYIMLCHSFFCLQWQPKLTISTPVTEVYHNEPLNASEVDKELAWTWLSALFLTKLSSSSESFYMHYTVVVPRLFVY